MAALMTPRLTRAPVELATLPRITAAAAITLPAGGPGVLLPISSLKL